MSEMSETQLRVGLQAVFCKVYFFISYFHHSMQKIHNQQLQFTIDLQFTITTSISENHRIVYPKKHFVHFFFLMRKLRQGMFDLSMNRKLSGKIKML